MHKPDDTIMTFDWADIAAQLDQEGFALLPGLLSAGQARLLATSFSASAADKCLAPEALGLGRGNLFHLAPSLPQVFAAWYQTLYRQLLPIAGRWHASMDAQGHDLEKDIEPDVFQPGAFQRGASQQDIFQKDAYPQGVFPQDVFSPDLFPQNLFPQEDSQENLQSGTTQPQILYTHLRKGDYQSLHQNTGSGKAFPLQLEILLSEPGQDFTGGEFVMTEQRPRMQSRPMVLPLRQGDAALIPVAGRPMKGSKGYYRANLKHAISRIRSGERSGCTLLFHNVPHGMSHE